MGQQREIFWSQFFSWIYSIWAPDFEAKRIFFPLWFSQSYSNILMNPRCRLLREFKISTVAYCAYCHSQRQPIALMYDIIFQCCGSGMFIPDPDFFPSWIPNPKKHGEVKNLYIYICFLTVLQLSALAETDLDS